MLFSERGAAAKPHAAIVLSPRSPTRTAHLSPIQHHILDALRANAEGSGVRRPDGSVWRMVSSAAADIDCGKPVRLAIHFAALREAGVFEPVGVEGGLVLVEPAEVRA